MIQPHLHCLQQCTFVSVKAKSAPCRRGVCEGVQMDKPAANAAGDAAETQSGIQPQDSIRDEMVKNAVGFLLNPKVTSSPEAAKRQFLKGKGLTDAEIDEAFRRVPQSSSSSAPAADAIVPSSPSVAPPPKPYHQPSSSNAQVVPYSPPGTTAPALVPGQPVQRLRWSQLVIGAALVAAGAYTVHQFVWPRALAYYHRMIEHWKLQQQKQEEQAAANAKLIADALHAQASELRSAVDSLQALVVELRGSKAAIRADGPSSATIEELREELRSISRAVEGQQLDQARIDFLAGLPNGTPAGHWMELPDDNAPPMLPGSTPGTSYNPYTAPGGSGYTAYSKMHTSGIDAANPRVAGAMNPPTEALSQPSASQAVPAGPRTQGRQAPPSPAGPEPPHPSKFMEVLEMLNKGEVPPDVRSDIDDSPPDPAMQPSQARLPRPRKPWERDSIAANKPANSEPVSVATAVESASPTSSPGQAVVQGPSSAGTMVSIPSLDPNMGSGTADGGSDGQPGGKGYSSNRSGQSVGSASWGDGGGGAWKPPPLPQPSVLSGLSASPGSVSGSVTSAT